MRLGVAVVGCGLTEGRLRLRVRVRGPVVWVGECGIELLLGRKESRVDHHTARIRSSTWVPLV